MIEFKNLFLQHFSEFFTLYNINEKIDGNTLLISSDRLYSSSFLRLICKFEKPTKGEIFIDNKNIFSIKDKDLNVGFLPKEIYLFENKTVIQNLIYPLKIRKIDKNTAKNLVFNEINELNLKNYLDFYQTPENKNVDLLNLKVKFLSPADKKIIALIRIKLRKPKYILIEDVFDGLTNNLIPIAEDLISKMAKDSKVIATACADTNRNCYADFKRIEIENGVVKK